VLIVSSQLKNGEPGGHLLKAERRMLTAQSGEHQ
jgi:hypothetical protein